MIPLAKYLWTIPTKFPELVNSLDNGIVLLVGGVFILFVLHEEPKEMKGLVLPVLQCYISAQPCSAAITLPIQLSAVICRTWRWMGFRLGRR